MPNPNRNRKEVIATRAALGVLVVWGLVTLTAVITSDATVALAVGPMGLAAAGFLFGFRTGGRNNAS